MGREGTFPFIHSSSAIVFTNKLISSSSAEDACRRTKAAPRPRERLLTASDYRENSDGLAPSSILVGGAFRIRAGRRLHANRQPGSQSVRQSRHVGEEERVLE